MNTYSEQEIESILCLIHTKLGWTPERQSLEKLVKQFPNVINSIDYIASSISVLLEKHNRGFFRKTVYNLAYAKGYSEGVMLAMTASFPFVGKDIHDGLIAGKAAGYGFIKAKKQVLTTTTEDANQGDSTITSTDSPLEESSDPLPPLPPNIHHINNDHIECRRV